VCAPSELDVAGRTLVGDGAVRYRALFEERGAAVPPDDDPVHVPDPLLLVGRAQPAVALEIRSLGLSDLDDIEDIEQRAYPTPWSRSMFASELAKPTSICLGAF